MENFRFLLSRIHLVRKIIISDNVYRICIVLVWVSMIDKNLNSRKKTSKFVYYEQYFKKVYTKAQTVTMIANIGKNWKNFVPSLFEITFMNSFVFVYMHSFLFGLSWHNHVKNYRLLLFFLVSEETKFEVDTTSAILSSLYHFRNVNKELFRYY